MRGPDEFPQCTDGSLSRQGSASPEVLVTPTISVDTTPVLSPAPTMESSPASDGGPDSIVADMAGGEDTERTKDGHLVTIFSWL